MGEIEFGIMWKDPDMDFIFPTWIIDGCIQMIEEPYTDTDKLIYY